MDFEKLVKSIQEFEGVSRKSSIDNVISLLGDAYNVSGDVVIDIGDDASAIDIGNNQVILVAADGIWGKIMNVNPYWAGYCSVLVNVNDIAAMGGKPLATCVFWYLMYCCFYRVHTTLKLRLLNSQ